MYDYPSYIQRMILVIDDEREFNFPAWYVRDISHAGLILANNPHFDQVWLDNDLGAGGEVYDLVEEIEKCAGEDEIIFDVDEFVIHTQNPVARERMYLALKNWYAVRIVYDLTPYLK